MPILNFEDSRDSQGILRGIFSNHFNLILNQFNLNQFISRNSWNIQMGKAEQERILFDLWRRHNMESVWKSNAQGTISNSLGQLDQPRSSGHVETNGRWDLLQLVDDEFVLGLEARQSWRFFRQRSLDYYRKQLARTRFIWSGHWFSLFLSILLKIFLKWCNCTL